MKPLPPTDRLYAHPRDTIPAFAFDEQVATVFDDMINRSVPGYRAVISLMGLFGEIFAQPNSTCYDLGCSLGASAIAMAQRITQPNFRIIGVDNSLAMLARCQENTRHNTGSLPIEWVCADVRDVVIERASIVTLNYTLQFIPVTDRLALLSAIYAGLLPGGVLLLSEKICFEDAAMQALQTELHHNYKRANGYSDLEISQKRSALENVLHPETVVQHQQRLRQAGFSRIESWYQCFNFVSLLAIK